MATTNNWYHLQQLQQLQAQNAAMEQYGLAGQLINPYQQFSPPSPAQENFIKPDTENLPSKLLLLTEE